MPNLSHIFIISFSSLVNACDRWDGAVHWVLFEEWVA